MSGETKNGSQRISPLLEGLDFGVVLIDRDLKVLWLNSLMERLFDIRKSEVQGMDAFTFFRSQILPKLLEGESFKEKVTASIATGNSISALSCQMITPAGETVWFEYTSQLIEQGPFRGMRLDIYRDVTLRAMLQKELERHLGYLSEVIEGRNAEISKMNARLREEALERSRAEEALQRERAFRANLVNASPVFIVALTPEGRVLMMNPSLLRALGLQEKEAIGRDFTEQFVPPGEQQLLRETLAGSAREGKPFIREFGLIARDGREMPVEWHLSPVLKADGSLEYHVAVGIDIAERKAIEEAQRRSERLYRTIFESTLAPTIIVQEGGIIYQANAEFERVYGYGPEGWKHRKVSELFATSDRERLLKLLISVEAGHAPSPSYGEFGVIDAGGGKREAILSVARIPETPHLVLSILDITERRSAEKAREEFSRHLFIVNQLISATTSARTLEESLEMLLAKAIELLGFDAGAIFIVESGEKIARLMKQAGIPEWLAGGIREIGIEEEPYRKVLIDGEMVFVERKTTGLFSFAMVPFLSGGRVVGALYMLSASRSGVSGQDRVILGSISNEIGNAIQRSVLQRQLEELVGQANLYLDIMSHDINNANTSSLMYAELLAESLEGENRKIAEKLIAGIRRSIDIISKVNTIRRIREGECRPEVQKLDQVIRDVMQDHPGARIVYPGTSAEVIADNLLSEVFANLIGNSLKFGGPQTTISINVVDMNDQVLVSVEDDGPGIPDELKKTAFKRFERGKEVKAKGSGLGLYLCRMLVERYGGKIWAEDRVPGQPSRGVAIRFTLRKA